MKTKKSNISGHRLPKSIGRDIPKKPGVQDCATTPTMKPDERVNVGLLSQILEEGVVTVHCSSNSSWLNRIRILVGTAVALIFLLLSVPVGGQIYLGYNFDDMEQEYPDSALVLKLTATGRACLKMNFETGIMLYYFNDTTNRIDVCVYYPWAQRNIKTLVRLHNKMYKRVCKNKWKYQPEDGPVMYIRLEHNEKNGIYAFVYSDQER